MISLIFHDAVGKITMIRSGDASSIAAEAELAVGQLFVISDVSVDISTGYVDGGVVYPMPAQPDAYHEFDYTTKQWLFSLQYSKDLKWQEMKAARTAQEFGSFDLGGNAYQCDEVSQRRLQGAVQLAVLDSNAVINWTLADNSVVILMASEIIALGVALGTHVATTHERGRLLRTQIEATTTAAELNAIQW
jgi:hypothetical protein